MNHYEIGLAYGDNQEVEGDSMLHNVHDSGDIEISRDGKVVFYTDNALYIKVEEIVDCPSCEIPPAGDGGFHSGELHMPSVDTTL